MIMLIGLEEHSPMSDPPWVLRQQRLSGLFIGNANKRVWAQGGLNRNNINNSAAPSWLSIVWVLQTLAPYWHCRRHQAQINSPFTALHGLENKSNKIFQASKIAWQCSVGKCRMLRCPFHVKSRSLFQELSEADGWVGICCHQVGDSVRFCLFF